jgi:hypothetical protein
LHGARALAKGPWGSGPDSVFTQVQEKSSFMSERAETFNKDMYDTIRTMEESSIVPEGLRASLFWPIVKTQQLVDTATWLGAYKKGLDTFDGKEAEAVRYADRWVARAQASGLFPDRSNIERGTLAGRHQQELARMWTTLLSYMLTKANLAYEKTRNTNFRDPASVFKWTSDLVMLYTVEALVVAALRGQLPGEGYEEDTGWPEWVLRETGYSVVGSVPLLREFTSEFQGFRGGSAYGQFVAAVGQAKKQLEQGEVDAAALKAINSAAGIWWQYPSSQINRMGEVLWSDLQGDPESSMMEYVIGEQGRSGGE